MRSLFFKIFASFWICTALIFGVLIATAERPTEDQIRSAVHRGLTPAILSNAEILIHSYEDGGCKAVIESKKSVEPGRMPLDLLDTGGNFLCDNKHRKINLGTLRAPGGVEFRTIENNIAPYMQ